MRILALSNCSGLDTPNGQVRYANCFSGVAVDLCCDISPHRVERTLMEKNYDGVFLSSALSDPPVWSSAYSTLWDVLHYQRQDYIGSCVDDLMLLHDKALSDWRSGMGIPGLIITRSLWNYSRGEALKRMRDLMFPLTLESNLASTLVNGITVHSEAEAVKAVDLLFERSSQLTEILARRYPSRFEQYTVFVFGNGDSLACWPVISAPYASAHLIKSDAIDDPELAERLAHCAGALARTFSVRDYCQIDFLVDTSRRIYFTGVDAAPSLTRIGACAYANVLPFRPEQVLTLLLLIFVQRTGNCASDCLFHAFPQALLKQLGF